MTYERPLSIISRVSFCVLSLSLLPCFRESKAGGREEDETVYVATAAAAAIISSVAQREPAGTSLYIYKRACATAADRYRAAPVLAYISACFLFSLSLSRVFSNFRLAECNTIDAERERELACHA